jgi:adenylate kinase
VQEGSRLGIEARTYMDRGEYVPDDLVVRMVEERLGEPDASKGFILDGFPRTVRQAQALEVALAELGTPLTAVVKFTISDPTAIRRITGRYTCPTCKRTYHQEWKPPANDLVCDVDGTPLEKRNDEDELTVKRRLAIYREHTEPLERYYEERGLLREVDAEALMDSVTENMLAALGDAV